MSSSSSSNLILHPTAYIYDVNLIAPGIYLGACSLPQQWLVDNNIKYILNVGSFISYDKGPSFVKHLKFDIEDSKKAQINKIFRECFDFINTAVDNNANILIHCVSGISRSVTIVIAYLMRKNNWSYKYAQGYVKNIRSCAKPNTGFAQQLIEFDKNIKQIFAYP